MPTQLLTYSDTAQRLSVSERTVRRLVARKRLKSVRIAGISRRIRESDLERFIEGRTV